MEVSKQIQELAALRLTQEDIALKAGVSVRSVSRWATGKVQPSPLGATAIQVLHRSLCGGQQRAKR